MTGDRLVTQSEEQLPLEMSRRGSTNIPKLKEKE
jgi:hypothetical protein